SKLYKKVNDLLQKGKRVTIVHPIIAEKHILTLAENTDKEISRRKSPKKESIYSLFKELTGLYPILLNKNFTLIVPEIHITEIRIKTKEPMQLQNKSRHYLKNWIIVDKQLDKIITIHEFTKANDYLKLLPNHLPKEFSCPLVYKLIKEQIPTPRILQQNIRIMFWVFEKTGLISFIKKSGRKKIYKKIDTEVSV
ncbi:MAG: hypothetical protein K6E51_12070, partial [Treponema sp.]|nr:hypothetical protein [Treponema sp.]